MGSYTYRLHAQSDGFVAECCEFAASAEGCTEAEVLENLRAAIGEILSEPNAVAPPAERCPIEILLSEAPPRPPAGPQGPGEAMGN
jgi:predicted RNase H-like HicB family nuclease